MPLEMVSSSEKHQTPTPTLPYGATSLGRAIGSFCRNTEGDKVYRRFEEVEEERSGTEPVENSRVRVDYSSSARLGIGLGRVRNVTPVVRALRVRERMRELGMDEMGRDQVPAAAQQFAAIPASRNRIVAASTLALGCGTICSAS